MHVVRRICLAVFGCLLAPFLPAQARITLLNGCGTLAALPGWSVIAGADFAAPTRPTDPSEEPAHGMLMRKLDARRTGGRQAEHLLLHAPGTAPGSLRLVDAWSAGFSVSSEDLQKPEAAITLQKELEAALASPGVTATFVAVERPQVFAIGTLALSFELAAGPHKWHVVHHVVPAGDRVQYFETTWLDGDVDARGEIETLLRTFDGAAQGRGVDFWKATLLGGGAGALAGMLMHARRRRRRAAAAR